MDPAVFAVEEDTSTTTTPGVSFVAPFRPSAESSSRERLEYPSLEQATMEQKDFRQAREARLAAATPETREFKQAQLDLNKQDLLECAWALQKFEDPKDQHSLARHFTELSVAVFGSPHRDTARALASRRLDDLLALVGKNGVDQERLRRICQFYKTHLSDEIPDAEPMVLDEDELHGLAVAVKEYFYRHFGSALNAIVQADSPEMVVGPDEIAARFSVALDKLKAQDSLWDGWRVEMQDSGSLSVRRNEHRILVGMRREPISLGELQGKFGHEVLVHAVRYVNAQRLTDPELKSALPGYIDAEEGLASLVDYAITGVLSSRAAERYVDIAFAMGLLDGQPVTRSDLFQMCMDRRFVSGQAAGEKPDTDATSSMWEYVNRIYRGTPGEEAVGVFVKDIMYYRGFHAIAAYIVDTFRTQSVDEVLDYLLSCKFNPFDEVQATRVSEALQAPAGPLLHVI